MGVDETCIILPNIKLYPLITSHIYDINLMSSRLNIIETPQSDYIFYYNNSQIYDVICDDVAFVSFTLDLWLGKSMTICVYYERYIFV